MQIELLEKTHTYLVNGDIASISVTELLAKHKLAPDYSDVKKEILKDKASKGKTVHKDIENILNSKAYTPTTPQGEQFLEWASKNLDCAVGEQPLALDFNGMIICGTCDIMGFTKDGNAFICDTKTTSKIYKDTVAWQVSLLDYMARNCGDDIINGKEFHWKGASKFLCHHYDLKENAFREIELEKVPDEEIEKLLNCEYNNEIYEQKVLVIDEDLKAQIEKAEVELKEIETAYKEAEKKAKELREQLCEAFRTQNVKSWESADKSILITYVCQTQRMSVDSTKLKKEFPRAYELCQKISTVKDSVQVKLRNDESEDK